MKISAIDKTKPALAAACLKIVEPGMTIGSCPDADMTLAGAQDEIGRIQAIVRTEDNGSYSVENMSAIGSVVVNGRSMKLHQIAPLQPGGHIDVGGFRLSLEDEASHCAPYAVAPPDPNTHPLDDSVPEPSLTARDDLFTSLLDGPGVIPVGASTPALHRNGMPDDILTDPRPTILNRTDPLRGQPRNDDISEVLERSTDRVHDRNQ